VKGIGSGAQESEMTVHHSVSRGQITEINSGRRGRTRWSLGTVAGAYIPGVHEDKGSSVLERK